MIANPQLHRIRTGEASPKEARAVVRDLVAAADPSGYSALYAALRSWTWKAMQTRRFDAELSEWFDVLRGASAATAKRDARVSHYLQGLAHLVDDSLRYGVTHHTALLLTRSHVGEILALVARHNGRIERDRLVEALGLTDSRLSQLLSELTIAGALERQKEGRYARFVLTDTGRELLETWSALRRSPQDADEVDEEPWDTADEVWAPGGEVLSRVNFQSDDADWSSINTLYTVLTGTRKEAHAKASAISIPHVHVGPRISEDIWSGLQQVMTKTTETLIDG